MEDQIELDLRLEDKRGEVIQRRSAKIIPVEGQFSEKLSMEIEKPSLWWPRGYGEQPLYKLHAALLVRDRLHQSVSKTVGFRRLVMEDTLHFMVNNVPVKLWGGNWVSPHWKTAVWDQERAEKLLEMAKHANFNALRVWGPVETPDDQFYEMADREGFMLWQDFTWLPMDTTLRAMDVALEETPLLVKRLMNHPSVFIWCGVNELAQWHHEDYNNELEDRGEWPGIKITDELRKICRELDPERFFIPSSPYFGIDPNDPAQGNTHGYTNLWFVPGYEFLNFASEDTRIAAPVLHSLRRFMKPEDIWPPDYSPIYKHGDILPFPETWMKYTTTVSWRKTGPVQNYFDPTDAASLVYRLGMAEAEYYRDIIERQRRGRPAWDTSGKRRCGGYMVWKYNDSWPQVYSAKVDYFLEPYHAYYTLKRAYQPVMLSFDMGPYIYLWAVNDTRDTIEGKLTLHLLHMDRNEVMKQITKSIRVLPGESNVVVDLYREGIGSFRLEHVLFARLAGPDGKTIAVTHALPDIERRYTFPDAKLSAKLVDGALEITTDKFAKSVTLTGNAGGDEFGWFFEDNYFDLVPGEVKTIRILGGHASGRISLKACYSPHVATIEWNR
jgi:hypothetical protein